jgi:acyl-CoA thioesterase
VTGLPGFWELLGFAIERADEREAVLRMDVPDALLSPFGTVHGGVIATLFDTGLAVAIARRLRPEDRIATHNLNVTYVAFTSDRVLRCRARVASVRRTVAVAEGEVTAADGTLVAKALGTFGILRPAAPRTP